MTRLLEWYGTFKQNEKPSPVKNGIRATFRCGNYVSVYSLTNTPFIGGVNGVALIRTLTILRTQDFEEYLGALPFSETDSTWGKLV